jgi:hypothetical protein
MTTFAREAISRCFSTIARRTPGTAEARDAASETSGPDGLPMFAVQKYQDAGPVDPPRGQLLQPVHVERSTRSRRPEPNRAVAPVSM